MLIIQITNVNSNKLNNPFNWMLMGNSTYTISHVIPIFITNPNKPKVNSRSGKKNIFNIGFIK